MTPPSARFRNCYCGGKDILSGLGADQIPQFVLLTFDDAVNDLNQAFYKDLFGGVDAGGHEIASHIITHSFGTNFNEEKWANDVVGEAELLVRYAGVKPSDIKGMRVPFLAVGGEKMFNMLSRYGLYYDSSMPTGSSRGSSNFSDFDAPKICCRYRF